MGDNDLYLVLGLFIYFEVGLGSAFRVFPFQILPDHDERQKDELENIRDEKPDEKGGRWVKAKLKGCPDVPRYPNKGPKGEDEKEAHRADGTSHLEREFLKRREALPSLHVRLADWSPPRAELGEGRRIVLVFHVFIIASDGWHRVREWCIIKITKTLQQPRINQQIRVAELRVIGPKGENLGILTLGEALKKAEVAGLDLIEISPNAVPPVAKIANIGRFLYEENKKGKHTKRAHSAEVKTIQVKVATGNHDLELKAKKTSEWLALGHRVRVNLFLPGRAKYLDEKFLSERLERMLKFVSVDYKIAEEVKKSPKGLTIMIERA